MSFYSRLRGAWKVLVRGAPNLYPVSAGIKERGLANADTTELLQAYRGWVFACASTIGKNVAKVPMHLYVRRGGEIEEIYDHPILELFEDVNPIQTRFELWWLSVVWLELCGKSFWYLAPNGLGVPREIWPIPPDRMRVVPDREKIIGGYLYQFKGEKIAFDAEEIIYLRYPHPRSIYNGMGTLQAATYEYDTDLYMKKHRISTFRNQARPDVVLETDEWLNDSDYERIREEWNAVYGGVDKAGKVGILEAGLKVKPFSQTMQELDFVEGAKLSRDDILGIFGVPASKLGLVEDVNRANAEANDATFQSEVIWPRLTLIAEKLNQDLCPKFDDKLFIKFENPTPENWEWTLKERETNIKIGYTSINEERAKEGKEPVPWGDVPLLPINLLPVRSGSKSKTTERQNRFIEDERRTAIWNSFVALTAPHKQGFKKQIVELFKAQRKLVLSNLKKLPKGISSPASRDLIDFILFPLSEAQDEWVQRLLPYVTNIVQAGVEKGSKEIDMDPFDIGPYPSIQHHIRDKTFKFSFEANETTLKQLREELTKGLEAGETIQELRERVNEIFDFAEGVRAERIARTETNSAANYGVFQAYHQSGLPLLKEWLTARDEKTREFHAIMDGQQKELSETFISGDGNALMYPGDSNAPAYEVINCRCTLISVRKEE